MIKGKNPVLRVTLLTSVGISIYHRSFIEDSNFDEHLFSGFTSAILSFSKQMGNDLSSISMTGMDLYFQQKGDIIVVLGIDSSFNDKSVVQELFDDIMGSEKLGMIVEKSRSGVLEIPHGFDGEIMNILSRANEKSVEDIVNNANMSSSITKSIQAYLQDDMNVKKLAIELIGENLKQSDADKKLESTEMINTILNSTNLEKETRKKLQKLLKEMKKNSNRAAATANRALF